MKFEEAIPLMRQGRKLSSNQFPGLAYSIDHGGTLFCDGTKISNHTADEWELIAELPRMRTFKAKYEGEECVGVEFPDDEGKWTCAVHVVGREEFRCVALTDLTDIQYDDGK